MGNDERAHVEGRLSELEGKMSSFESQQVQMLDIQKTISSTMAENVVTQKNISKVLQKLETSLEDLREFQIRTEESRKADEDHRNRLDRRLDNSQRDLANIIHENERGLDKVWSEVRRMDDYYKDEFHKIDKRLSVDDVQREISDLDQRKLKEDWEQSLRLKEERRYKFLFWAATTLLLAVVGKLLLQSP